MVVVFATLAMVMLVTCRRVGVVVDVHTVLADPVHTDVDMPVMPHLTLDSAVTLTRATRDRS